MFFFCIGNSSNTFLLLKAQARGFSASQVMLLYLIFNVATSALAIPSGKLSDKYGRSRILVSGYLIYGLVYLGFALLSAKPTILFLFIAYGRIHRSDQRSGTGFYCGKFSGGFRGTLLGLYGMLQGIGLLLSSIIAGLMWDKINSNAPFLFGGVIGMISALMILLIFYKTERIGHIHGNTTRPQAVTSKGEI